jgi:hypothetical protein
MSGTAQRVFTPASQASGFGSFQVAAIRTRGHPAGRLAGTYRFSLSYRDVEELLAERALLVDHVTVWRWVQRDAPQINSAPIATAAPTDQRQLADGL